MLKTLLPAALLAAALIFQCDTAIAQTPTPTPRSQKPRKPDTAPASSPQEKAAPKTVATPRIPHDKTAVKGETKELATASSSPAPRDDSKPPKPTPYPTRHDPKPPTPTPIPRDETKPAVTTPTPTPRILPTPPASTPTPAQKELKPASPTPRAQPEARNLVQPLTNWDRIRDWLNENPVQAKEDKDKDKDKEKCKFEYRNLPIEKSTIAPIPEEPLPEMVCIKALVVPKEPAVVGGFKGRDFDGTVFDPYGPQPEKHVRPFVGPISLFSTETGELESSATTDAKGRYKFSRISAGRKALFTRDKAGNFIYLDNVQVCERGVDKDGKGCTEMPRK